MADAGAFPLLPFLLGLAILVAWFVVWSCPVLVDTSSFERRESTMPNPKPPCPSDLPPDVVRIAAVLPVPAAVGAEAVPAASGLGSGTRQSVLRAR